MPVTVQVIASVRRWGGTHSSTQAVIETSVGAMVKPQQNRTAPRATTLPTQGGGGGRRGGARPPPPAGPRPETPGRLSLLFVDRRAPGVELRPMTQIIGH